MSDGLTYHKYNPDPLFDCCRNSGVDEDGITFDNIDPWEGTFTFIGKTQLVHAVALAFGKGPRETLSILTENNSKALRAKVGKLEDENALLRARLADINKMLLDEVHLDGTQAKEKATDARSASRPEEQVEDPEA